MRALSIIGTLAARNIRRRLRKSLTIIVLVAASGALFCLGASIIEKTNAGVRLAFIDQCTADLSVSAPADMSFGIFGSDIPVVGENAAMPALSQGEAIDAVLAQEPAIQGIAYQLSTPCAITVGEGAYQSGALGFGVVASEYARLFPGLKLVRGEWPSDATRWVLLPEERAAAIEQTLGRPLKIGEPVLLSFFRNESFAIREVKFSGVLHYPVSNQILSKVVIADARTVSALTGSEREADEIRPLTTADQDITASSIDDLFKEPDQASTSGSSQPMAPVSASGLKDFLKASVPRPVETVGPLSHNSPWNFILIRLKPEANRMLVSARLNQALAQAGFLVQVRDWRGTAGAAVAYVSVMQVVFVVGLLFLTVVVIMITLNSIMMSVMERTAEIGGMRAMGASKPFVSALIIAETLVLTGLAALIALGLGLGLGKLIAALHIPLNNELLSLLFGDSTLGLMLTPLIALETVAICLGVGFLAAILPVRMAVAIRPIRAIQKA